MSHLFERLEQEVAKWRADGYPSEEYPAISEILEWAGETETGDLRCLRQPQLQALETYWFLRLVEETPHIFDLYKRLWGETERKSLLEALGVTTTAFEEANYDLDELWERIASDDDFVRTHRMEALRESLSLEYASYILALAMGAGKTVLVGAIIATEFAMAQEYPEGPFVQNALVFAPGKTIVWALRELNDVPYDRILPPRMFKTFAASVKLTFTRDGEKDIPVVRGSVFNVVVTNTEKIRIRKEAVRKSDLGTLFDSKKLDEAKQQVANLRLQAIASLPHLAIFSDEAHHTYGQSLQSELKRVRQTVDYLAQETNVICVVNTTGTLYFRRQPLKDVVVWYSLSEGINDGILKNVAGNIRSGEFDESSLGDYVTHLVRDFFADYGDVTLPNGAKAKLAMYFPQTDDLAELKPTIEKAAAEAGVDPSQILVNTSDRTLTSEADIDAFNRLNDPDAPHRLILLVNKGTEGWNCPSLFGCALVRKLKTSNNFVLQAASRCLRQVPGNQEQARIYLSQDNYGVLDRQLAETYGESIEELNRRQTERRTARLVLRKEETPPIIVTLRERVVRRRDEERPPIHLTRPKRKAATGIKERAYTLAEEHVGRRVLLQVEDTVDIDTALPDLDHYAATSELSTQYRVPFWDVYDGLRRLYPEEDVPTADLDELASQIEDQTRDYEELEETVERSLALVKPTGFRHELDDEGNSIYTAEIVYRKEREALLVSLTDVEAVNPSGLGFHYDPYNFGSNPEKSFLVQMLEVLNLQPHQVEDIYFTGGITDPSKTDFLVQYKDDKGKWRDYTPDFVVRLKPENGGPPGSGRVLIVEVKDERHRNDHVVGEKGTKAMAVRRWENLNPERIKYEIVFAEKDMLTYDELARVREFIGLGKITGPRIPIDVAAVDEFCARWKVKELYFFGSVLRDDFRADSDVDVMVVFEDGTTWGTEMVRMKEDLAEILGRKVDLTTKKAVEETRNWVRRRAILEGAELVHSR